MTQTEKDVLIRQYAVGEVTWQQQCLGSIVAGDVPHGPDSNAFGAEPESVAARISHGLCGWSTSPYNQRRARDL